MKKLHIFLCFLSVLLVGINLLMLIDTDGRIWLLMAFYIPLGFIFDQDEIVARTLLSFFWAMALGSAAARSFQYPLEVSTWIFVVGCFGFLLMFSRFIHDFLSLIGSTPKIGVQ